MTYRIALVDDDRFLLDLYALKFKNAGHDVSVFESAKAFLESLHSPDTAHPDIALIDVIMPDMTGFELVSKIRGEGLAPSTKIVFLTNQGQDADIDTAKKLSVDGYIIKASAIPSEVCDEVVRIIEKGSSH